MDSFLFKVFFICNRLNFILLENLYISLKYISRVSLLALQVSMSFYAKMGKYQSNSVGMFRWPTVVVLQKSTIAVSRLRASIHFVLKYSRRQKKTENGYCYVFVVAFSRPTTADRLNVPKFAMISKTAIFMNLFFF